MQASLQASVDAGRPQPLAHSTVAPDMAGASVQDGGVDFRLWAPAAQAVWLHCEGFDEDLLMHTVGDGWHSIHSESARPGTRYRYRLPDGTAVPDPVSRFQPEGIDGPSEVIDPAAYRWSDSHWHGRAWPEAIVYELHIGTFTAEGTFRAAIDKLDHLAELGVTCINLMPVAQFPGRRNWGYDGVFLYAPACAYGRPDDLRTFVDAAHRKGLMVLLDVVYNHFGPDGNRMPSYAPQIFTDRHQTPWGDAVNFDADGSTVVRELMIQNALYWIREFHFDGLRLDAVHAIIDDSRRHVLEELADRVREAYAPRDIHLVIENESNRASRLVRDTDGMPIQYTAQWNDDVHHVLHTALTGETDSYYVDFEGSTQKLGRALAEGFAFQGERMRSTGSVRGESTTHLPPVAFVSFLQNHDQVGNRAMGDRIHALAPREATRAAAAVYLLLPQVPMLFMGEEWATTQPFPFFSDFEGDTGRLVRKGRREEFAEFAAFKDPLKRAEIPDPQDDATFEVAKLAWHLLADDAHAGWLAWYRQVIATRKRVIVPLLRRIEGAGEYRLLGQGAVDVRFPVDEGRVMLTLVANLSPKPCTKGPTATGRVIWQEGRPAEDGVVQPWSVRWSFEPSNRP